MYVCRVEEFLAHILAETYCEFKALGSNEKSYEIRLNVKEKKLFPFRTKLRTDLKFKLYPNNEILGNS